MTDTHEFLEAEYDAVVTRQLKDNLEKLGTRMGLDPQYWKVLRVAEESAESPTERA